MVYALISVTIWMVFILLTHFARLRNYYPTLVFTGLLGLISDLLGVFLNQWIYHGPVVGGISLWSVLGIATAEGGIFIRLFPKSKNCLIKILYWIGWALINTLAERFLVWAELIGYLQWNSLRAFFYYLFFFGAVWLQEYWYNGTGRLRK